MPPTWARQVVVVADAGFAANETLRLIAAKKYAYVFAMHAHANLLMAIISVTWSNTCPSVSTIAELATNRMVAGRITGFCSSRHAS